jgi:hypothetical protein
LLIRALSEGLINVWLANMDGKPSSQKRIGQGRANFNDML